MGLTLLSASPASAGDTYQVDPAHSMVVFKALHLGVGHTYGLFRQVSGTLVVDEKKPEASQVSIEVEAESLYTGDKKRDTHLRSPDFLNVKQYPKITFKSTKVRKAAKGAEIEGDLSLHGVTRSVKVQMDLVGKGKDPWGNDRVGFEGSFQVKLSDHKIAGMPGAVGETITLTVAVEGIKKK